MKDAYKRRRLAESELTKALPEIDPSEVVTPSQQERLVNTCGFINSVVVQENEFIVVSNSRNRVVMYTLKGEYEDQRSTDDSISDMTNMSDEEFEATENRTPIWRRVPVDMAKPSVIRFVAKDVIACTEPEKGRFVSTWCARSGERLDSVTLRNVRPTPSLCKISDTEFVVGSEEGHLCFFTHNNGCDVKETKRVRKAHRRSILFTAFHGNTVVSSSKDYTARLWDTRKKEQIAILPHNGEVHNAAISNRYILTCGDDMYDDGKRELRIYLNDEDGYALLKILRGRNIWMPRMMNNDIALFYMVDENYRDFLMFLHVENELILAVVKVACRSVWDFAFLPDERLVAVGTGGCRGVIATLPRWLRNLMASDNTERTRRVQKRSFCSLM